MLRFANRLALLALFLLGTLHASAQSGPTLQVAQGTVQKAEKDMLVIKPRNQDGTFAKNLALKLTGTSKISSVSAQKRSGKTVLVQRDVEAKDLEQNQPIAVIYTTSAAGTVLLSAVVQPAP